MRDDVPPGLRLALPRGERKRGWHGRLKSELRWRGNLIDGQRRCYKPGDF